MVLRDKAGMPLLVTDDPEEFVEAVDAASEEGQAVHWDDPGVVNIDRVREQADAQKENRAALEELRRQGRLNEHDVVLPSERGAGDAA
jgi:hypothetical protein